MSITWAYGLTTVLEPPTAACRAVRDGVARRPDLLLRTVASLEKAGFPRPRLFIDGPGELPLELQDYDYSQRLPHVRTMGNFTLGLWELYLRYPQADRYAMFQDDFVTCLNLRDYLDSCEYKPRTYWNLYTFPANEQPDKTGWYVSNQKGLGAVALVFSRQAVIDLLGSAHWLSRPQNLERGWRAIDGGIVDSLRKAQYKELVHRPSLIQHTGTLSAMGNQTHAEAVSFIGETFDARQLIQARDQGKPLPVPRGAAFVRPRPKPRPAPVRQASPAPRRPSPLAKRPSPLRQVVAARAGNGKPRIGLVGYNCASGLGELNRQLAEYADLHAWLVKPHGKWSTLPPHPDVETIVGTGDRRQLESFVRAVDVVLFCETPFYPELIGLCKQAGRRTVCVPMQEWMPQDAVGWPRDVDLFLCPTMQCYDAFQALVPCVHFPWPVDLKRFPYKQRTTVDRFLFVNGHGGWGGRKGAQVLKDALALDPSLAPRVLLRSQAGDTWPKGTTLLPRAESNADLYAEGDVLVSPHSVDGLGLEGMEAMTAGMPVVSTDGRPWDEIPALARIPAKVVPKRVKRLVDWYVPDPQALARTMAGLLGKDISRESTEARRWAEANAWPLKVEEFNRLVREGKP